MGSASKRSRVNLDLNQNEGRKFVLQLVASTPTSPTPVAGQVWYRTDDNLPRFHDGTGERYFFHFTSLAQHTSPAGTEEVLISDGGTYKRMAVSELSTSFALATTVEDIFTFSSGVLGIESTVAQGAMIYAQNPGSGIKWTTLPIGSNGDMLVTPGTNPTWTNAQTYIRSKQITYTHYAVTGGATTAGITLYNITEHQYVWLVGGQGVKAAFVDANNINLQMNISGLTAVTPAGADSVALYDASGSTHIKSTLSGINSIFSILNCTDAPATSPSNGQILAYDTSTSKFVWEDKTGTGATTFTGLTDTPSSYSGYGGYVLSVNGGADGLMFAQFITAQQGGMGASVKSSTIGTMVYVSSANVYSTLAPGTSGQFLMTQGSGSAPVWSDLPMAKWVGDIVSATSWTHETAGGEDYYYIDFTNADHGLGTTKTVLNVQTYEYDSTTMYHNIVEVDVELRGSGAFRVKSNSEFTGKIIVIG